MLHRGPMSRQHYSKNFYVFPLPANTPPRHSFRVGPPREEDIKMLIVCKRLKEFNVVHPPARTQGWGVLLGSRDPAPPPPAHYLFIINTFTDNCVVSGDMATMKHGGRNKWYLLHFIILQNNLDFKVIFILHSQLNLSFSDIVSKLVRNESLSRLCRSSYR